VPCRKFGKQCKKGCRFDFCRRQAHQARNLDFLGLGRREQVWKLGNRTSTFLGLFADIDLNKTGYCPCRRAHGLAQRPRQPLPVADPGKPLVNEDPTGGSPATMTVHDLMTVNLPATCNPAGCLVAGFSENLYVDSTATDGWNYELGYDASAVRAFVLSKVALPMS